MITLKNTKAEIFEELQLAKADLQVSLNENDKLEKEVEDLNEKVRELDKERLHAESLKSKCAELEEALKREEAFEVITDVLYYHSKKYINADVVKKRSFIAAALVSILLGMLITILIIL